MNSLQAIIDHIEQFYNNHLQVKKVGSDFKEQLFNFATKDEKYPIVFVVPVTVNPADNTSEFNFDIYCFDIIQKVPNFQPLNNDLLDYAAGYVMNITLTVNDWTDCAVPLQ